MNPLASATVTTPMDVPQRVLMGPGPSNTHPRALAAMSMPQLGHMHPPFLKIMDEVVAGLQVRRVHLFVIIYSLTFAILENAFINKKCS